MRLFKQVDSKFIDDLENLTIKKPKRSTELSAGYDFYAPKTYVINPGESAIIPTYIKAYMESDEVLIIAPRSSFGYNYDMVIKSTIGVGKHFAQGIFMKYLITDDDHEDKKEERRGGIGSTSI